MRRVYWLSLVLLLPVLAACETDDDDVGSCEEEQRDVPYEPGMSVAGDSSLFTVALDSADPAPPDLDENDWTLSVLDAAGSPVEGCVLAATPWMPDHGHGSNNPESTELGGGSYSIAGIDFIMAGYWEVGLEVDCAGETDTVEFRFCIEG